MGSPALWRLAVRALLLSVPWLVQCRIARALTPSADFEQLMARPGVSLGDVLLIDAGTRAPKDKDVSGGRTRKLRNHLAGELRVSQESFARHSGQNEGNRVASRLSSSHIEISKVELGSTEAHGFGSERGGLAVSADLSGRMALQSAVGSPILLSKEENPYYYMQQGNYAGFGEVPNAGSITKLELGFVIVAVVLLLLGLSAGAYFALYGSTNQADADGLTDVTKPQDGKEQRVLRLRSQSLE